MDQGRRRFIGSATAFAAAPLAMPAGEADSPGRDGRAAITRAEMNDLAAAMGQGRYTCVRTLEANDGPFYYESSLRRRDITEGRRGMPLKLEIRVVNTAAGEPCSALAGAVVDVWQADADGLYSNVGVDVQAVGTVGQTFLRGHLVTDAQGRVEFDTIVPGWELVTWPAPVNVVVRATHIHVKVFHESKIATTQLYLPDPFLEELYAGVDPYRTHRRMTAPGADGMFDRIRNTADPLFLADQSSPLPVLRQGRGVSASATIGINTMGTIGVRSRFR